MPMRLGPVVVVVAISLALAAPATAAVPPGYKSCKGSAIGSFYRQLQVKGTTCAMGRKVMRSRAAHDFDKGGSARPYGFICRTYAVRVPDDPNGGLQYNCANRRKHVRFYAHP